MFGASSRTATSRTVTLNVYDLHAANEFIAAVGLGLYHSGVEIDGREYVFGQGSGIADVPPRSAPNAVFRVGINMGAFDGDRGGVARALDDLRTEFQPDRYDVITKNCNHFADALVFRLLGRRIPSWVNRAAMFGSCVACLVPRGDPTQPAIGGATGGGGGSAWTPAAPAFTSFEGRGYARAAGSAPAPAAVDRGLADDEAAKRDARRNAALRRFGARPD